MGRRKSSRQKRKTIVRNNFYLFGKAMSAEPGFVVLSALMRVVVSVRTSFLRVIFLAYIISCMEQKKTLATFIGISFLIVGATYAVQSFSRIAISRCVRKSWYSLCSGNCSKKCGRLICKAMIRKAITARLRWREKNAQKGQFRSSEIF